MKITQKENFVLRMALSNYVNLHDEDERGENVDAARSLFKRVMQVSEGNVGPHFGYCPECFDEYKEKSQLDCEYYCRCCNGAFEPYEAIRIVD